MNSKFLAGASMLAIVVVLVTAWRASAQNWTCDGGCYPNYAYAPSHAYASGPLYDYYGAYDSIPWNYRGGPHPR